MRYPLLQILLLAVIIFIIPIQAYAEKGFETSEDVFQFVKKAFNAQVALSEKERTLTEIHGILSPHFTDKYISLFLDENLVKVNGKYLTLGSDFALYYIPFFSYGDETKIEFVENKIYVYEFYSNTMEGPVNYNNQYEGILITNQEGSWKISKYLSDFHPEEAFKSLQLYRGDTNARKYPLPEIYDPFLTIQMCLTPFKTFMSQGAIVATKHVNSYQEYLIQ